MRTPTTFTLSAILGLGALGLASTAYADTPPAAVAQPSAAQSTAKTDSETGASDTEEVVCRRIKVTGSRVRKKRICMTVAQWEDHGRMSRDGATKMQEAGLVNSQRGG
ncbi:hypothetical protein [Qipengyuania nanhaisediminis]|uniref:Uncharacterized protein n=1 Tax=Qipengyuania nanhaisediminis TaxID=604088 RepID=A0A1I5NKD2_9SPHN|nr:hypothetical protein [Qipengyuania nanhaisediminis]SFP22182.1 hypothetical protein SAMN04488060_1917 [Qipengyuania nanhaisediminis]